MFVFIGSQLPNWLFQLELGWSLSLAMRSVLNNTTAKFRNDMSYCRFDMSENLFFRKLPLCKLTESRVILSAPSYFDTVVARYVKNAIALQNEFLFSCKLKIWPIVLD